MRMDLAGERFEVEEGYRVDLPPGNHLIVVAGVKMGEPAYDFDHLNIVAKKSELFEFKHYRKSGNKFWTSKAGISFYLAIPKAQIEILPEKGYSYVPVLIQGRKCILNVSGIGGGIDGGWTDYVRRVVDIGCGWKIAALRSLAGIALSPDECRARGSPWRLSGPGITNKRVLSRRLPPSRCGPGWDRAAKCSCTMAGTTRVARGRLPSNPDRGGNGISSARAASR